jgi:hypothetical protein
MNENKSFKFASWLSALVGAFSFAISSQCETATGEAVTYAIGNLWCMLSVYFMAKW